MGQWLKPRLWREADLNLIPVVLSDVVRHPTSLGLSFLIGTSVLMISPRQDGREGPVE